MAKITTRDMERTIIAQLVNDLLDSGLTVTVNDGEDSVLRRSADREAIMAALFATDEELLFVFQGSKRVGWVKLIYGNDGWDVISDHTMGLQRYMEAAEAISDRYSAMCNN